MPRYQYGEYIISVIEESKNPLTLSDIIAQVAEMMNKKPDDIADPIKETISAALVYGFMNRENGYYTLVKEEE